MPDVHENSSDISEVFSGSNNLSSNDNVPSGLYFNEPEYTEQGLEENMTKCSTGDILNTKRVEELPFSLCLLISFKVLTLDTNIV